MAIAPPKPNIALAIGAKLGAVTCFIVMATMVKIASETVPTGQIVFFRSFCALPVIIGGLVGTMGMTLGFLALGLLPLSEVKAIQYAQPVLVVIFAAMFLGERVRVFRLTAVALGMAGVLVIMWPRLTGLREAGLDPYLALGAIVAFGSAVMAALAHVFVRKLTAASTLSLITVPFGWVMPSLTEFAVLIAGGLVGGIGIGYFIFAEVPTLVMLLGISLIVVAGVLIIWRERQLGKERAQARKVMTPQG